MSTLHPQRVLPSPYPNLANQPQDLQDAVKRAYDDIYQLRGQMATVVAAHNQLKTQVDGLATTGQQNQQALLQVAALQAIAAAGTAFVEDDVPDTTVTNVATPIITLALTMPSVGGPWRVFVGYSLYLDFDSFTDDTAADFWVTDGTEVMSGLQTGQSNASSGARTSASYFGLSPVTYDDGVTVNFTLMGQMATHSVNVKNAPVAGSGPMSNFQLSVLAAGG